MALPTITIKAGETEVDITLDGSVEAQLEQGLGENIDPDVQFEVTDFDDLDEDSLQGFEWNVRNLIALGEIMADEKDSDRVCAGWVRAHDVMAKPDVDDIKDALEHLTWVGSVREDEKDYAQHVIDEGLMDEKSLQPYFDHEKFGSEALMDSRTSTLKNGSIIVWNKS